jgi:hypothetical protein
MMMTVAPFPAELSPFPVAWAVFLLCVLDVKKLSYKPV